DTGTARSEARAAVDAVAARILEGRASSQPSSVGNQPSSVGSQPSSAGSFESLAAGPQSPSIAVGNRVIVGGLGLEATVTAVHDRTAERDVRGKRMRASVRDLRVVGGNGSGTPAPAKVNVHVELQPRETPAADLNVIGCTVDEALSRAERFLDETL